MCHHSGMAHRFGCANKRHKNICSQPASPIQKVQSLQKAFDKAVERSGSGEIGNRRRPTGMCAKRAVRISQPGLASVPHEPIAHGHALGFLRTGSIWLYPRRTGRLCDRTVWLGQAEHADIPTSKPLSGLRKIWSITSVLAFDFQVALVVLGICAAAVRVDQSTTQLGSDLACRLCGRVGDQRLI